jgi:hypothetical protein
MQSVTKSVELFLSDFNIILMFQYILAHISNIEFRENSCLVAR